MAEHQRQTKYIKILAIWIRRRAIGSLQILQKELACACFSTTALESVTSDESRHTYLRKRVAQTELLLRIMQSGF
jgi:hypothetical protein